MLYCQSRAVFSKIDQEHGLSNNRIWSIKQDKNKFIWIATTNGLNRYDGTNFKIFNELNSNIASGVISDIYTDKLGNIWIGTSKGLSFYNEITGEFINYTNVSSQEKSTSYNQINCIYGDSGGNLWLGSKGGISKFNIHTKQFKNYELKEDTFDVKFKDIRSFVEDASGDLYAGSFGGGLFKLNTKSEIFDAIESGNLHSNFIFNLLLLPNGTIMLGTGGGGAIIYNPKQNTYSDFFSDNLKLKENVAIVRNMLIDHKSNLWLCTDGEGLFKIEDYLAENPKISKFKKIPQRYSSLSGNAVYTIFQDIDHNYWIGTAWNGINYLQEKKSFDFIFSDVLGKQTSPVLSVYKTNNTLYFGLDGHGLTEYNTVTEKITHFKSGNPNYLGSNTIQCILRQKDILWLGTFSDGLIKVNLKTYAFKQFKNNPLDSNSISYNDIRGLVEDPKGNLWIATGGGGLNYYDVSRKQFLSFKYNDNDKASLSSNNLTSIQLEGNNLWLGSSDGGVNLFDIITRKAQHYQNNEADSNTISSNNILSLFKDSRGNLWVGTFGEGINKIDFETNKIVRFDEFKKLRKEKITGIIEDDQGSIWISTKEQGILSYEYKSNQFTGFPDLAEKYHRNAVFKDINGELLFGGTNGVIKFDPKTINYKEKVFEVLITDFMLYNKPVEVGTGILSKNIVEEKNIFLEHHDNVITFEFAALHYPSARDFEYNIQMENFDKDWREIGTDNKVTYTNLAPGNYKFKIRSRRSENSWSNAITSVNLKINKPFWLEWWAILLYVVLIGFIFYFFRKYIIAWEKMKSNLELEKLSREKDAELGQLKQQFFTNISHEIRTPVTLILSSINTLLREDSFINTKQLNPVNTIRKNSNHLLNLINKLLDYRKLENKNTSLKVSESDWVVFCHEIFLSFKELANQKSIDFQFESTNKEIDLWFDKRQMEKVIYNLLSNALKFTDNGKQVFLKLSELEDSVTITLKDQGIGIQEKYLSKIFSRFYQPELKGRKQGTSFGLGLNISKEIVDLHEGEISVDSTLGKGTTFTIVLKKGKKHFHDNTFFVENGEDNVENYTLETNESVEEFVQEIEFLGKTKETTILVVEDNKDILEYIVSLLSISFTVLEASNGKQGLDLAKKQLPDLIISDVMMPLMDGQEMTKLIKSNINTSHIPILLLTARTSLIHQQEGYAVGAEDYITKPFNEVVLISKIKSIIKNRQLIRERMNADEIIDPNELSINEHDQKMLEKLIKLIEENIDSEVLNSKFITTELGISHSVIYKKIKALTGLSLIEFITEIRLKTARRLILENDYTVIDACYKVGYSNRKYFSKLFKKRFGKNPSEYRKKRKESLENIEGEKTIIDIDKKVL